MRILLYALNFTPEPVGIGKYTGEMARWLVERGHRVKIVCAPPYYPDWRIADDYSSWRYRTETIDGAEVLRCPLWVPKQVTGLKRVLHLGSFALSSAIPMLSQRRWRPDVIFAVEPPLFGAIPALLAARLTGAQSWLHVQDFEVDAAFDLGLLKAERLRRMAFNAERALMRRFDCISTISEKMVERAMIKTEGQAHCLLFPNWVDTQAIYPQEQPSPYRAALNIPENAIVLLYSGSMGQKQGLELILDAARALQSRPALPLRHGWLRLRLRASQAASRRHHEHALAANPAGEKAQCLPQPGRHPSAPAEGGCRRPRDAVQAHRHARQRPARDRHRQARHPSRPGRRGGGTRRRARLPSVHRFRHSSPRRRRARAKAPRNGPAQVRRRRPGAGTPAPRIRKPAPRCSVTRAST